MELVELFAEIAQQVKSRDEIQQRIFRLTRATGRTDVDRWDPDEYKERWLPSDNFYLMDIPLDKLNDVRPPHDPKIVEHKVQEGDDKAIVIDKNVPENYVTEEKPTPWKGDTLIMDGCHRAEAYRQLGKASIKGWVGEQALPYIMGDRPTEIYHWWKDEK